MKINLEEFEKRVASGHIRRQHTEGAGNPEDRLTIWNYTVKTSYDRVWDEYTMLARGLITRADGAIHARSFRKFFNLGEPSVALLVNPETVLSHMVTDRLPFEDPEITMKMDGFLGILYWHEGDWHVASRGSFTSEYAQWASKWLRENNPNLKNELLTREHTLVFEILYPNRRIVVDNSGKYGLVLLAVVNNDTGVEAPRHILEFIGDVMHIPVVRIYRTSTLAECVELAKTLKGTECEGFVAYYPESGLRVKVKGDDYCKIHRICTWLSVRKVWEIVAWGGEETHVTSRTAVTPAMVEAKLTEICSVLPSEYADWVMSKASELLFRHAAMLHSVYIAVEAVGMHPTCGNGYESSASRKDVVRRLQAEFPDIWHEALRIIDGQEDRAVKSIWKRIEPAHELPILRDGEDE